MSGAARFELDVREVVRFHDACVESVDWPEAGSAAPSAEGPWPWIETNHVFNTRLWREEDLARRRAVPDSDIAANKRNIDGFNQRRNDATEGCDEALMRAMEAAMRDAPRLHSETPGMMIDRLSILALKIRAMALQSKRADVDEAHRVNCSERLARLREQRDDLAACLDALLADCLAGRARFKLYRQFKMYNDPALNPSLYAEK